MAFSALDHFLGEEVPWLGHERDDVVLLADGSRFALFELQGISWETADDDAITDSLHALNHTYCQIADSSLTIMIYQHRGIANGSVYPDSISNSAFASSLQLSYKAHLLDGGLYQNRLLLGLLLRPPSYKRRVNRLRRKHGAVSDADHLQQLDDLIAPLLAGLHAYQPRRLGIRISNHTVFSEIAETIAMLMTGMWHQVGLVSDPTLLGDAMFNGHLKTEWDSFKYIGREVRFGATFGLQLYPAASHPFMLSRLLACPYSCTIVHSFRFVSRTSALDIIEWRKFLMSRAGDPAVGQREQLPTLKDELANGQVVMGDHSFRVLVFHESEQALEKIAAKAWTDIAECGGKIVRETLALKPAWLSMIPGNEHRTPRSGYILSRNFTGFAPLHGYPAGHLKGHWGSPICVFRSSAGTPIYYHWQVDDVGNTLITGATGSGKTLLIGFLIAMTAGRAKVIALDHKRGWNLLIHEMAGNYTILGSGQPNFAPLKSLTIEDAPFLMDLLRGCIIADGHGELTAEMDARLNLGIRMVMELEPAERSIWEVRAFLGVQPNGPGARLEKWCDGKELGWVLDAPTDAISLRGKLHGLDTTALLGIPRARGPALLYMFYRIRKELTGDPLLLLVDEGWAALLDDVFRPAMEREIRTIRSRNGAVVFITQGVKEILDARIRDVLVEQCPNQIHLPNPRATEANYVDGLKRTKGEFDALKKLPKGSHQFLLCRGDESVVAQLSLEGMDDAIAVLSSREDTLKLFDKAMVKTKNNAQQALPLFHIARREEVTV